MYFRLDSMFCSGYFPVKVLIIFVDFVLFTATILYTFKHLLKFISKVHIHK